MTGWFVRGCIIIGDIRKGNNMIESSQLYFFMGASLVLLLVPGPAVLYITARSANQGRLAGLVSVLAIETANFLQAVAAALGRDELKLHGWVYKFETGQVFGYDAQLKQFLPIEQTAGSPSPVTDSLSTI